MSKVRIELLSVISVSESSVFLVSLLFVAVQKINLYTHLLLVHVAYLHSLVIAIMPSKTLQAPSYICNFNVMLYSVIHE